MARKEIKSGSEEFELFRDFWELFKDNAIVENTEAYFEKVTVDVKAFYQKHKTPFAIDLSMVLLCEIERRYNDEFKVQD